jgi:hypothetical protein
MKIKFTFDDPDNDWIPIEALHLGKIGKITWDKDGSLIIQYGKDAATIKIDAKGRVVK